MKQKVYIKSSIRLLAFFIIIIFFFVWRFEDV